MIDLLLCLPPPPLAKRRRKVRFPPDRKSKLETLHTDSAFAHANYETKTTFCGKGPTAVVCSITKRPLIIIQRFGNFFVSFPFVRISEDDDESLPRAAALTIIIFQTCRRRGIQQSKSYFLHLPFPTYAVSFVVFHLLFL